MQVSAPQANALKQEHLSKTWVTKGGWNGPRPTGQGVAWDHSSGGGVSWGQKQWSDGVKSLGTEGQLVNWAKGMINELGQESINQAEG